MGAGEMECLEAIQILNSLGNGLGSMGFEAYQRLLSAEVRPRLLRCQEAWRPWQAEMELREAMGELWPHSPELSAMRANADAVTHAMEAEISTCWQRLYDTLTGMLADDARPLGEILP